MLSEASSLSGEKYSNYQLQKSSTTTMKPLSNDSLYYSLYYYSFEQAVPITAFAIFSRHTLNQGPLSMLPQEMKTNLASNFGDLFFLAATCVVRPPLYFSQLVGFRRRIIRPDHLSIAASLGGYYYQATPLYTTIFFAHESP